MIVATRRRRAPLLAVAALALAGRIHAQSAADSAPIIRAIDIDPGRIFDSAEATSAVYRVMNALHIKTKPSVIRQQLLFRTSSRWDTALVNETERNLRALQIFRLVRIDSVRTDSGLAAVVRTQDAWTTGIVFSIKASGSQIGYAFGVNERNLLGSGTRAQVQYGKNPDRDSVLFGIDRNFLFGTPLDLSAQFNKLSDGRNGNAAIELPFRTLTTRRGGTAGVNFYDGRILQYFDGDTSAQDTLRRAYTLYSINPAIALRASNAGYVHVGLYAQLQSSAYAPYALPASQIMDTLSGALGPFLAASYPRYRSVRYYQAAGRKEDLDLGVTGTLGVNLAPGHWGYSAFGAGPNLSMSFGQGLGPDAWVTLTANATSLYHAGLDSGSVDVAATFAWQPSELALLVAHAEGGAQKNGFPGENYDLGFGYAVRAFPQHAYTGDRMFQLQSEFRWIAFPDVAKLVGVGFAAFVDYGGAWYSGAPQRTGTDAGIGLRFGSITAAQGLFMRADLAYRWANDVLPGGWVFTFGKGFVWQNF